MAISIRELHLLTWLSLNNSGFTDCPYPLQTGEQEKALDSPVCRSALNVGDDVC